MKKTFELDELDCANCGAKMEAAIKKIDGVEDCTVSFLTQKLTLTAPDDRFNDILKQAKKVCKKIEPDCEIIVK